MIAKETPFARTVRWVGLLLFPTLIALAFVLSQLSRRRVILFLSSFSFQTSLIGWLYLLTRNPYLGQFSTRYLSFVALVWMIALANLETNVAERVFNELLHYAHPLCVTLYWNLNPVYLPGVRVWLIGLLYPLSYFFFMLFINHWIGYELYPVLSTSPILVLSLFVIIEVLYWNAHQSTLNKS